MTSVLHVALCLLTYSPGCDLGQGILTFLEEEGGREGERRGGREGGREGERKGGREGGREGGR